MTMCKLISVLFSHLQSYRPIINLAALLLFQFNLLTHSQCQRPVAIECTFTKGAAESQVPHAQSSTLTMSQILLAHARLGETILSLHKKNPKNI